MSPDPLQAAYQGKAILVTGALGYVGSAVISRLSKYPCSIFAASRRTSPSHQNGAECEAEIKPIIGDVSDPSFWSHALEESKADVIFHFAAQNSVYAAANDPQADFTANVLPVMHMVEAIRSSGIEVDVLYSGTATQAGMTEVLPVGPQSVDRPVTVYDLHKLMAEQYLKLYARNDVLRAVTLRLANVYGPGTAVGSPDRGILNKVINTALNGGAVSIYGAGDFVRDYIYIDDVVEAFVRAGCHMDQVNAQHYFLGSGAGHKIKDVFAMAAEQAAAAAGHQADVSHVPWPEGLSLIEERNFIADITDLCNATGWKPDVSLTVGIGRTIDAFIKGQKA